MEHTPGLHIELVATDETPDLLTRNADIGFWTVKPKQLDIIARKIGEVSIVAIASRTYIEKFGQPQQFSELAKHRLIGHDRIDAMVKWFAKFDPLFNRERFCFRTDDKMTCLAAVRAGMGIGFVAQYLLDEHETELCQITPGLPLPSFGLWLGTHRDIIHNALIKTVYDALIAKIAMRIAQKKASL
jgi:DNA-binding transcriptional LysR family regulator